MEPERNHPEHPKNQLALPSHPISSDRMQTKFLVHQVANHLIKTDFRTSRQLKMSQFFQEYIII